MAFSVGSLAIYPLTKFSPSKIGAYSSGRSCSFPCLNQLSKKPNDFKGKMIKLNAGEKRFATMVLQGENDNPLENVSPSLHSHCSNSVDLKAAETYAHQIEGIKEEVRNMLLNTTNNDVEKITLIDTLERLGLSYIFEKEIQEDVEKLFKANMDFDVAKEWDLHTVAVLFRIFRQRGFDMSTDVFNKFKDGNGEFDKSHITDIKGLLSLYEAAHLRRPGEDILEEAVVFTKGNLRKLMPSLNTFLQKQVSHTLYQTIWRGWPRIEAHHNIAIYGEDETRDDILLRIAKLDYNLLQMLHKQELYDIRRWWKNLNVSKITYPIEKVIEAYYAGLGMYFEPHYSLARNMATKTLVMASVIDDTYHSYCTIDELETFTEAIQRWNVEEIHQLPNYMKIVYATLIKVFQDHEEELEKQGRAYAVEYARERFKELVKSYYKQTKWLSEGYMPEFDEYMENALITTSCFLLIPAFLLGVETATKETFDFLQENPKIIMTMAKISRLMKDLATHEIGEEIGQVATGIGCYMKQYGVSEKEAYEKLHEMAEDAWKDLNEELLLNKSSIPMEIAMTTLNYARLIDVFYKYTEYGNANNPGKLQKSQIISILVDPIEL